jgi:hypothetical protein
VRPRPDEVVVMARDGLLTDERGALLAEAIGDHGASLAVALERWLARGNTVAAAVICATFERTPRGALRVGTCCVCERRALFAQLEATGQSPRAREQLAKGPPAEGQVRALLTFPDGAVAVARLRLVDLWPPAAEAADPRGPGAAS